MPKNLVPNHFDTAGIYVEGERSSFRFNKPHIASFMAGMLVPLGDPIPVFPGVKLDLNIEAVIRSNTMVVPPLDGMYIDFATVWVPHRIVWNHMAQFLGENDTTAWTQSSSYVYPCVKLGSLAAFYSYLSNAVDLSVSLGNLSLSTHYGLVYVNNITALPSGNLDINMLAYRGYYFLWNYLFRDENYQRPVLFDKGDTGSSGEFGYLLRDYEVKQNVGICSELSTSVGTGLGYQKAVLMPVNKFHDAFTSVLPEAQFGDAVELNLGSTAPVIGSSTLHTVGSDGIVFGNNSATPGHFNTSFQFGVGASGQLYTGDSSETITSTNKVGSTNLVADLSNATASTINQFRTSVMYQRYLEALARGGRRVPEYYQVIYGVKNSAATKDYPILMTRARYQLGVNQVVATADGSGTGWTSHLGDTGAYSLTNLRNVPCVENDFTEFGYLHIVYCVRSGNRYSQMVQPHFLRRELLDEYNPFFDHIGDVTVPNTTVNVLATTAGNFGFQEAWWDERTQLGLAVGAVNKLYGSLNYWIIGEKFAGTLLTCTPSYLTFDPGILNDIFVSAYYTYPQFIIDALIHGKKVARMSQHSIPGIVGRI